VQTGVVGTTVQGAETTRPSRSCDACEGCRKADELTRRA